MQEEARDDDADWIPDSRDKDDIGENAHVTVIDTECYQYVTKEAGLADDEGELGLMMLMHMREGRPMGPLMIDVMIFSVSLYTMSKADGGRSLCAVR
jgi:hypothetical protein